MIKNNNNSRTAILLSIVIVFCAIYVSILLKDWMWLSRSGSLIVIIGIILTSSQIIENDRLLRQRHQWYQKHINEGSFRDWAMDKQLEPISHSKKFEEEKWKMGKCGFNLLIVGTFIWGFGDLTGLLF
ncbi:MAG: hypothetical protein QM504_01335 [Pseudomonadota bacterium]